jgi:hypothetical protein
LTDCHDTPEYHDSADENGRPDFLQNEVTGHFQQYIGDEEHEERNVVIRSLQVEVLLKSLYAGIADVDTVKTKC